jgi:ankyrin repeat protein
MNYSRFHKCPNDLWAFHEKEDQMQVMLKFFKKIDANGDEKLSREEIMANLGSSNEKNDSDRLENLKTELGKCAEDEITLDKFKEISCRMSIATAHRVRWTTSLNLSGRLARLLDVGEPFDEMSGVKRMEEVDVDKLLDRFFSEVSLVVKREVKKIKDGSLMLAAAAGHTEAVKVLVELRADVNADGDDGMTALMLAAEAGKSEAVKVLVELRADVNAAGDDNRMTALMHAAGAGKSEAVKLLVELRADVNAGKWGRKALISASQNGHTETVIVLVELRADVNAAHKGETVLNRALRGAAGGNHTEAVKVLVELRADVNAGDDGGSTALMEAASHGQSEAVKVLVELRADVNAADTSELKALTCAVAFGHSEAVKMLVELRADVNAADHGGMTALQLAASNGHFKAVKVLVELRADVNAALDDGRTALKWAEENNHPDVVAFLQDRGGGGGGAAGPVSDALNTQPYMNVRRNLNVMVGLPRDYPAEYPAVYGVALQFQEHYEKIFDAPDMAGRTPMERFRIVHHDADPMDHMNYTNVAFVMHIFEWAGLNAKNSVLYTDMNELELLNQNMSRVHMGIYIQHLRSLYSHIIVPPTFEDVTRVCETNTLLYNADGKDFCDVSFLLHVTNNGGYCYCYTDAVKTLMHSAAFGPCLFRYNMARLFQRS